MRTALALLMLLVAATATAQSMKVTLDPPRLTVNEPGELSVEIIQEGPGGAVDNVAPVVPPQPDVAIRYIGPSTQVSIVNGRATQRVEHRYAISASKAGTYTIGPITVRQQGALKEIGSVRLEVLTSGAVAGPTEGESAQLSLTLAVPRTEVYLHEHIPLSLALRVGQVRVADLQYPMVGGDGFSIEKLSEPTQRQEQVAGGTVQVVEFATTLTPLRAGTLSIGPATMRLNVLQRERRQDRFFGFFGETRRPTDLRSEPLNLTVLPLPEVGRPATFSGAVGQFQLEVRATPLDPMAGDPVTVTSTVRGQGNLDTLNPPAIAGTDALRVYPVQQATRNVPSGTRAFEQVVIPGTAGEVTLPPLVLSYFDPSARTYKTLTPAPVVLRVQPGVVARTETPAPTAQQPADPAAETPLGQDIVFLKDSPGTLQPIGTRLYRSVTLWTFPLVPVVAWLGAVYWDRRRQVQADPRRARASRAGEIGRAVLNYERARRLAPSDPDVLANLAFARSRGAEAEPRSTLSRILFPLADRMSTDRLFVGAIFAWTVFFALLAVMRLVPRARVGAGRGAIVAALVTVVFLGSGIARLFTVEWASDAIVVSDRVATIRFEPSATGAAHFDAKPGAVLKWIAERDGWAQVARSDGRRGWVERAAIEPL